LLRVPPDAHTDEWWRVVALKTPKSQQFHFSYCSIMLRLTASNRRERQDQVLLNYTEHNGWEQEVWYNCYVFDHKPEFNEQLEFLVAFMHIFDACSRENFEKMKRQYGSGMVQRRTVFEIKVKLNVCEGYVNNSEKRYFEGKSRNYKSSFCYSFENVIALPHYREIKKFCELNGMANCTELKLKLKAVLADDTRFSHVFRLFYKSFGDYQCEYGDVKTRFCSKDFPAP
jgi:hypothetical protein